MVDGASELFAHIDPPELLQEKQHQVHLYLGRPWSYGSNNLSVGVVVGAKYVDTRVGS